MQQKQGTILVIDDDIDVLLSARVVLKKHFTRILQAQNFDQLKKIIAEEDITVVLLDMNFKASATSGKEGLEYLGFIRKNFPDCEVVMMTAYGDIDIAVQTMKKGAADFIVKPWDNQKLVATMQTVLNLQQSKSEIKSLKGKQELLKNEIQQPFSSIIAESEIMKSILQSCEKVAKTDASIIILGENGTGKEMIAREIYAKSKRKNEIFVNVDLGAIPETLFESELFGSLKGAFTDSKEDRIGKLELADNGTIFLDEIGNIPVQMQVKLLNFLQNKRISKLGSNKEQELDVRIISATNMPLTDMIKSGRFRQDLYYRINTVEIKLPALRNRTEDILPLANHFLGFYAKKYQKGKLVLSKESAKKLLSYNFPGNIRELQHMIERAVILSENSAIQITDFNVHAKEKTSADNLMLKDIEKSIVMQAITKHNGNISKASKELGMGRATLYRKMKKYGF